MVNCYQLKNLLFQHFITARDPTAAEGEDDNEARIVRGVFKIAQSRRLLDGT